MGYGGSKGRLDVTPESSWADDDSTIEEEVVDSNIFGVEKKVALFNARNTAMRRALMGEWFRSFDSYVSVECRKWIDAIRKSRLPETAHDIIINMTLTMHPFSSNVF